MKNVLNLDQYKSPVGMLRIGTIGHTLRLVTFDDQEEHRGIIEKHMSDCPVQNGDCPKPVKQALDAYFEGEFGLLDALEINPHGTTFQIRVWDTVRGVRAGMTTSYGEIAGQIGNPKAVRAVGRANGQNPLVLVVPCHRIIGKNGSLVGYGGGLDRKEWLLHHEGAL
jgi:methylated-DNA-[protein]-cysteine S-methyltransferase